MKHERGEGEVRSRPMTLDEIGKVLGISRERVRQIEKSALAKIRKRLERVGKTVDDFL